MPAEHCAPSVSDEPAPVAVVTGAAHGIGAATARALRQNGYRVAGIDRQAFRADPPCAATWQVDVTDAEAVRAAAAEIEHTLGPARALVNVAGVLHPGRIADLPAAEVQAMLSVNVLGVLHCLQAFAPHLRATRPASVVTVASNSAGVPRSDLGAYGATKAAASALTRSFGLEEARNGIRCNVIAPGSTSTAMLTGLWTDPEAGAERTIAGEPEAFRLGIPAGRIADPADIANAVAFLVSDAARHIYLQELYVDGGATLHS